MCSSDLDMMKKSSYGSQFLSGGIILTGGGSQLEGMPEAFEKYFGCSVRVGTPNSDKVVDPHKIVLNPSCTAAIGAVASTMSNTYAVYSPKASGSGFFSKISKWFEETF